MQGEEVIMELSIVFLLAVFGFVYGNEDFRILDSIRQEEGCSSAGGICTIAADCPQLTEECGLCPEQQNKGVECCYGLSIKETRCKKRGGECIVCSSENPCNENYVDKVATDCGPGEKCFIYTF